MMQAPWSEPFHLRAPVRAPSEGEPRSERPAAWEDVITFGVVLLLFASVVGAVDNAGWAEGMPSLYPIALLGLLAGVGLARSRLGEPFAHALALLIGGGVCLGALLVVLPGGSPEARVEDLVNRMRLWSDAAFGGGISTDELPFIVLVVSATWVGAYASAWAVFRWRNAWLGVLPGGLALLTHISYLPDQFSFALVFFLFGAILLVARLQLTESMRRWRFEGVPYPEFLSLSTAGATLFAAAVLLGAAWVIPQANGAPLLTDAWDRLTSPIDERLSDLGRVFVGVESKKAVTLHRFEDTLPFQGPVELKGRVVMEVRSPEAGYLRGQTYEVYTPSGWRTGERGTAGEALSEAAAAPIGEGRRIVTLEVTPAGVRNVLFTLGELVGTDIPSEVETGASPADVAAVRPRERLSPGDRYTLVSAVPDVTPEQLRAAGESYPEGVLDRYLPVPEDVPFRVRGLALDLTREARTPYDAAVAIESFLRLFATDFEVPVTPAGRDTVDYFLFEVQRGYFDYQASAMAIMLRSIGIPARVAVGYVLTEDAADGPPGTYVVTEEDAFTWPEVYFPGAGWVPFNPSSSQPPLRGPDAVAIPGAGDLALPPVDETFLLGIGVEEDTGAVPTSPEAALGGDGSGGGAPWALWALAGAAIVAVLAAGGGRWAWERGLSRLDEAGRVWAKTVRMAAWAGLGPDPDETPREYVRLLARDLPRDADLPFLADVYSRSRYGRRPASEEERQRLRRLWSRVRRPLIARVLARRLPFIGRG